MKKLICGILIVLIILCIVGCAPTAQETSRVVIGTRYTPSRSEVVTDYEYKYSWWHGDFKIMPNTHTVTQPEKYELLYKVYYYDGNSTTIWKTVDRDTYMQYAEVSENEWRE